MANQRWNSFTGFNFASECKYILENYKDLVNKYSEDALDKAAELMTEELKKASPVSDNSDDEKHLKDTFRNTEHKYRHVRYVGADKRNENNIPLLSLIEFSKTKGKPFVRKTFKKNEKKLYEIIKGGIKNA